MKKIKDKSNYKYVVGVLCILIGVLLIASKYIYNCYLNHQEDAKIEEFYENETKVEVTTEILDKQDNILSEKVNTDDRYIAILKIPKIGLEKGLYDVNSINNQVDKNIEILKSSNLPDVSNGNFILASHDGNTRTSYFKNLNKLSIDDEVIVIYEQAEYKYKIVNIYEIEKTGSANIIRNSMKTTITLITCKNNTNKQIVVIGELVERNGYNG